MTQGNTTWLAAHGSTRIRVLDLEPRKGTHLRRHKGGWPIRVLRVHSLPADVRRWM